MKTDINVLDLRRIARSQSESAGEKTVFSEGGVPVGTSREEKQFAAEMNRSGDEGVLRKSSKALTLSIVIPAYNEEHHLRACLDSVAAQTVKPDEVIVVNNNSSDKTAQLAKSYKFVKVISEATQGIVFARKRGFNSATSDIIGRIDADTILPPNWAEYIKEFYSDTKHLSVAWTGGCYFYNVRLPRFNGWMQSQIAFRMNRLLLGHYILFGSNMALPKNIWQVVKKDVCYRNDIHEDLDLAIHLHRRGYKIAYDEQMRVGIKMRRVRSDKRKLLENNLLWPKTLRVHNLRTWVFGWLGAYIMYLMVPVIWLGEFVARIFGKEPLPR